MMAAQYASSFRAPEPERDRLVASSTPTPPAIKHNPICSTISQSTLLLSSTGLVRMYEPVMTRISTRTATPVDRRRATCLCTLHLRAALRTPEELPDHVPLILMDEAARVQS